MEEHYSEYRSPVSKLIKEVSLNPVLYDPHNNLYKDNAARYKAWQQIAERMKMPVTDCQIKWGTLRRCLANARKRQMRRQASGSKNIKRWRHQEEMSFLLPYIDRKEYDYLGSARKKRSLCKSDIDNNDDTISQEMYISEEYEASDFGDESSTDIKPHILTFDSPTSYSKKNAAGERSSVSADEMYIEEDEIESADVRDWQNRRSIEHIETDSNREHRITDLDEMDAFFLSMSKALKKLPLIEQIKVRSQVYNTITRAEVGWLSQSPQPDSIENIPKAIT